MSADVEAPGLRRKLPQQDPLRGRCAVWHGRPYGTPCFIADVTPPAQRTSGMKDKADGPLVMVAREAIASSDLKHNRVQLSLSDAATHEMGKDGVSNDENAAHKIQALDAAPPEQKSLRSDSMSTRAVAALLRPGLDRSQSRAAPPLRATLRVHRAGDGGDSARHRHAQGRQIGRLYHRAVPRILLLLPFAGVAHQRSAAAYHPHPRRGVAAGRGVLRGRRDFPVSHGKSRATATS